VNPGFRSHFSSCFGKGLSQPSSEENAFFRVFWTKLGGAAWMYRLVRTTFLGKLSFSPPSQFPFASSLKSDFAGIST
jgi:hypothetical protein